MKLSENIIQSNQIMQNVGFGLLCSLTGKEIHVNDTIKFIHNDLYNWHEFLVCYSLHASKFYLLPVNFEDKPISLIQQYLGCDGNLYKNEIVLVKKGC